MDHVAMPKAEVDMASGMAEHTKRTRWVKKVELNETTTTAPGVIDEGKAVGPIDDDGGTGQLQRRDDDTGIAPVIDVGDAEVPVGDDIPLENNGKRDLKAEAVSLEHMRRILRTMYTVRLA